MYFCQVKASFLLEWAITGAYLDSWVGASSFGWIHMKTVRCGTTQWEAVRRGSWTLAKNRVLLPFIHVLRSSLFLPYLCPATFLFHVCNVTVFSRAACVELAQAGAATLLLWSFLLPKSLTVFLNFNNFRFVRFNPVCTEVGEITLNDTTILRMAMLQALVSVFVCLVFVCF